MKPYRKRQWLALLACSILCVTIVRSEDAAAPERSNDATNINVTVAGEVNAPGRYPLPPNGSLDDLLRLAGGAKEMAADIVYLNHAGGEVHGRRFPLNLKDKREGGPGIFREGDSVEVPRAAQFSISGEVNKPGTYRLDSNMTVREAIQKAGNPTNWGGYDAAVVQRKGEDNKLKTIKPAPDDFVEPDDIIRVKAKLF
jgi:polysaccharide export outer membrane protein